MRWLACLFGCLLLANSGCLLTAQRPTADPKAIVEKAIIASGGMDGLATLEKCSMQTKGVLYNGDRHTPFQALIWQELPMRFKQEMRLDTPSGPVTEITVVDGDLAWRQVNGQLTTISPDEARGLRHAMRASRVKYLSALVDPAFRLATLPETTIKGRPALGVRVSSRGEPDSDLYFDKDQGVLIKYACKETPPAGKTQLREEYYEHYADLNGLPWPMRKSVFLDGKLQVEREALDYRPIQKFDRSIFTSQR